MESYAAAAKRRQRRVGPRVRIATDVAVVASSRHDRAKTLAMETQHHSNILNYELRLYATVYAAIVADCCCLFKLALRYVK